MPNSYTDHKALIIMFAFRNIIYTKRLYVMTQSNQCTVPTIVLNKPCLCTNSTFSITTGDFVNRERGKHKAGPAQRPGTGLVNTTQTGTASAANRQSRGLALCLGILTRGCNYLLLIIIQFIQCGI